MHKFRVGLGMVYGCGLIVYSVHRGSKSAYLKQNSFVYLTTVCCFLFVHTSKRILLIQPKRRMQR